ncbi:hypothetical protein D9756_005665 [Leucocoprinus leucothites]|uniref:F-box domain-containing protein n=1 Tax=Leucocoprinus leucothites TaxID=201217 RepID=A0A8H5D7E5_9AGAR|nr:hypothetical protein D9756_005665 [Leucoagaricus leucothites]
MRLYSNKQSCYFHRTPLLTDDLPLDILPIILEGLGSRQDFHACTLVNKTFNRIATPLLYRELNTRTIPQVRLLTLYSASLREPEANTMRGRFSPSGDTAGSDLPFKPVWSCEGNPTWSWDRVAFLLALSNDPTSPWEPKGLSPLHHPSSTLLKRPHLAKYVRHITETGSVHRSLRSRFPTMMDDILRALSLCTNLRSLTWSDDSSIADDTLLSLIEVIRKHKHSLKKLTIRTHSDLGAEVWEQLNTLTGLRSISLWCMEGPPRVLQDWSEPLGPTLTHLELGRCAGVPPTILITVLSHLPLLTSLRLKGAPANSIPTILTCLPNLRVLDTEYLPSFREAKFPPPDQMPVLRSLTVRTHTIDTSGKLWSWIKDITPNPGLEKFKLPSFTMTGEIRSGSGSGTMVPRMFLLELAEVHGGSLKEFDIGNVELTMTDVRCVKSSFENLELIACAVAVPGVSAIRLMISGARNLHTIIFHVHWIPDDLLAVELEKDALLRRVPGAYAHMRRRTTFTLEDAIDMMRTPENPNLRTIGIGRQQFVGKWVLVEGDNGRGIPKFEVFTDRKADKWIP